jgi:hypothetical protein
MPSRGHPLLFLLEYKQNLLNHLMEQRYRRIKWFFYCDDKQGNTLRVFDRQFLEEFGSIFGNTHVLLRGKNLGQEGGAEEFESKPETARHRSKELRKNLPASKTLSLLPSSPHRLQCRHQFLQRSGRKCPELEV